MILTIPPLTPSAEEHAKRAFLGIYGIRPGEELVPLIRQIEAAAHNTRAATLAAVVAWLREPSGDVLRCFMDPVADKGASALADLLERESHE